MTGSERRDHTPFNIRLLIQDYLDGKRLVTLKLQSIYVPEGTHPSAATASFLVIAGKYELNVQMLFAIVGEEDSVFCPPITMHAQFRISGNRLTYPADLSLEYDKLESVVMKLLDEQFGDKLKSLEGLRQLQTEHLQR